MKAAVLAAGLGTRLRPLTDICPKPLMPVLNRPLLGLVLAQLEAAGCFQVAVNTHHLADQVHDFLRASPGVSCSVSATSRRFWAPAGACGSWGRSCGRGRFWPSTPIS